MAPHNNDIKLKVRVKINGKPRFRIGAWLIRLGAHLARVHVKIWIEEQGPRMGRGANRD